jgi:hypothetical protein
MPSSASPGTSTRHVESASTRASSSEAAPTSASPPPSTHRGAIVCRYLPASAATTKLQTDSGMNTSPPCNGDNPSTDCSHSDVYRLAENAAAFSSSAPTMIPVNDR